jgi:ribosomal protein S18 acetylase RimI-like enzyme
MSTQFTAKINCIIDTKSIDSLVGEIVDEMLGETSLHVWDMHIEDDFQRKGLGKHLLTLMELIARR